MDTRYNIENILNKMECDCYQQSKDIKICLCCGECSCGKRSNLAEHELYKLEKVGLLSFEFCEWYMQNEYDNPE